MTTRSYNHRTDRVAMSHGTGFTPEQEEFLIGFANNANNGKRFLCTVAHILAYLGAVGAALGSILGGAATAWTLWQRMSGGTHG